MRRTCAALNAKIQKNIEMAINSHFAISCVFFMAQLSYGIYVVVDRERCHSLLLFEVVAGLHDEGFCGGDGFALLKTQHNRFEVKSAYACHQRVFGSHDARSEKGAKLCGKAVGGAIEGFWGAVAQGDGDEAVVGWVAEHLALAEEEGCEVGLRGRSSEVGFGRRSMEVGEG